MAVARGILSGGRPTYVASEYNAELGMALGVTPEALAQCLQKVPEVRTVFIVSPTYYGMAADVGACADVAHAAGVALVVDNSWGAHFGFHAALPPSPLVLGADAMLTSTHKIVGSLTQSAMLHVAPRALIDPAALERAVRLVRSTSPSSLLFASLDAARRQLAVHGDAQLGRTLEAAQRTSAAIEFSVLNRKCGSTRASSDASCASAATRLASASSRSFVRKATVVLVRRKRSSPMTVAARPKTIR